MDVFEQAAVKIIKEQQNIIGPIALEQAKNVKGLSVSSEDQSISLSGDKSDVLGRLVSQYKELFGQISIEVCKDAIRPLISKMPPQEVPELLK